MNYKNSCRTCLGSEKEMRNIHSNITISGEDVRLSDILQNFFDYKVTEDLTYPENLCINCIHHLTLTYSFKILIESSARTLSEDCNVDTTSDNFDCNLEYNHQKQTRTKKYVKRKVASTADTSIDTKLLFCVECKAEFNSAKSLNEHCITNHPVKSSTGRDCEYCLEKFDDFRSLVLHTKLHLKPFVCENCWDGFYTHDDLNSHTCQPNVNKDRNTSLKQLKQCDQCGKSYPPGYIRVHMLTHSNDRRYSCRYCPKKFKVPGGLHSHVLWNHKRTRNYKCEVCNATFITSSSRSSHIRKNHLKEKKYGCDNCGKRFFSKSELLRHSLTHTGVKNFHCHLCDKSYQTRYGLNVHLRSHTQMDL